MYFAKIEEISLPNKYRTWYLNICRRAQLRATTRVAAKEIIGQVDLHHIVPKGLNLGGDKDPNNFAFLSPKEHFVCHLLLTKMLTGQQLIKMNYAMTCFARKSKTRILTSAQYATAVRFREEKFDTARCDAISAGRQLTPKIHCVHCNKSFDPGNFTKTHGDLCRMNPFIDKKVLFERSVKGRAATKKAIDTGTHFHKSPNSYGTIVCPHCSKTGVNLPNMKKNHFDNCKQNVNSPLFGKKRPPTMRKLSCINCRQETDSGNFAKYHGSKCRHPKFSGILPPTSSQS